MAMRENVLKEQTSLDQQRAEVKSMDAELERKRAALDPSDAAGKQALLDEEARRNQIGDTYNARLPSLEGTGRRVGQRASELGRALRRQSLRRTR